MTAQHDPGVHIGIGEMYREVQKLGRSVDRIENKLDEVLRETTDIRGDVADHETRLRVLERGRWPLPTLGVLAGVAGSATGLIALYR
ncbi:hypothetical protein [Streptomyces odonnellii]|uniref:hypothetical protein n=1 Tax=Streptomyces odonnellii TaxID=1417980 RepID=UPI000B0F5E1C|nr:hypothetical protein [Streptomyces odonnellii]